MGTWKFKTWLLYFIIEENPAKIKFYSSGSTSGSALDETTQEVTVDECDPPADGDAALSTEIETNLDLLAKQKQQRQQQAPPPSISKYFGSKEHKTLVDNN